MAAPTDRVQLLKNESAAGGGDAADENLGLPALLDATEDAPEMQGFFLQPPGGPKDGLVYVKRDAAGNILLRDNVDQTERTISQLAAADDLDKLLTDDVTCDIMVDDVTGNVLTDS